MRTSTLSFMRPQVTTDDSPKFYPHFAATGIACCPYDLCALNLKFYEDLFSPPTIPPSFIRTLPQRESLAALMIYAHLNFKFYAASSYYRRFPQVLSALCRNGNRLLPLLLLRLIVTPTVYSSALSRLSQVHSFASNSASINKSQSY